MKHRLFLMSLLLCMMANPVPAALRFGLGNAVAKRSADLINTAGANTLPARLPSCGGQMSFFTVAPISDPSLKAINPIGHVFPPGHTFPADHGYFLFNTFSTATLLNVNLYAPSDGWVTQTTFFDFGSGGPQPGVHTEYFLGFSPCAEVTFNILGIVSLVPALTSPTSPTITSCSSDNHGVPGALQTCVTTMAVPFKAGQLI